MASASHEGRRLKAALALADKTAADLADEVSPALHIGLRTIERVMQGARTLKPWERDEIARALGVPPWFLERGLDPPKDQGEGEDETAALEVLEEVARSLTALAQRVSLDVERQRGGAAAR